MRALVVSQYYPPEPGATQNRIGAFVEGLIARGHSVTVICEQPNHPGGRFHPGFGRRPLATERLGDGLKVHRLWVATSPVKSTAQRIAFYGTFALGAGAAISASPAHDVIFATSPPLPGALAAALAARARRTPFVLDVRDLWPSAAAALGEISDPRVITLLTRGERWIYRAAVRVTATTRPFCRHIDALAGAEVSVYLPNGALDSLLARPLVPPPSAGRFVVGYVGNLGIAQGLGILLDAAERLPAEEFGFLVVGGGPLGDWLRRERERRRLDAIELRDPVPVDRVGGVLEECNALLVPLRASTVLEDFIPSKLYDAMAVGRPAIVAARGEAAVLAREAKCGVVVPPEDGEALAHVIRSLSADRALSAEMGAAGRRAAHHYARSQQLDALEQILTEASMVAGAARARATEPHG